MSCARSGAGLSRLSWTSARPIRRRMISVHPSPKAVAHSWEQQPDAGRCRESRRRPLMAADIWFLIVVLGLMLYVALDGYDLGMGILALTRRSDNERRALLELVSPVWDGNESWILLVAVGLWGGFPAATGALLPAVYLAVIIMVFSLIARGASIEMVSNATGWPQPWGTAFMGGSLCAAFVQGVVVGAVVHGIPLGPNAHFVGGSFDFLSGYSVLTGLA